MSAGAWVKAHWAIVASVGVMVVAPPAMIYVATRLANGMVADVQKQVTDDANEIQNTKSVKYSIPAPVAGGPPTEVTGPPNQRFIDFFKEKRKEQAAGLAQISKIALEFNRGKDKPREPLVAGVFPDSEAAKIKRSEFQTEYIRRAYPALLKRYNVVGAIDPALLQQQLCEQKIQIVSRMTGKEKVTCDDPPPDEQLDNFNEQMKKYRIQKTRDWAAGHAMFLVDEGQCFYLPAEGGDPPDMRTCYDWQWQYWIREDIFKACELANRETQNLGIPGAVVKRIDSIRVEANRAAAGEGAAGADPGAAVPMDPKISLSGRVAGPGTGNGMYDIRNCWVTVVLARDRIPRFIDALAQTNFMTVLDMDLQDVAVYDDLKIGFYYGPPEESVVRVTFFIETVWMREWTRQYMPHQIREEFGIPDDAPPPESAPAPAPAPTPPPRNG